MRAVFQNQKNVVDILVQGMAFDMTRPGYG